jgi:hypothetical protein
LQAPDPDVAFDLATVFATTYDRGRFARKINYGAPLRDLRREDQDWATEIVRTSASNQ